MKSLDVSDSELFISWLISYMFLIIHVSSLVWFWLLGLVELICCDYPTNPSHTL